MATEGFKRERKEIEKKGGKEEEEKGRKNLINAYSGFLHKANLATEGFKRERKEIEKKGGKKKKKGEEKTFEKDDYKYAPIRSI